jgi:RNA polymerase sigma-70 factor (ECF subfamily)
MPPLGHPAPAASSVAAEAPHPRRATAQDWDCLRRLRAGDERAFAELVSAEQPRLLRLARTFVRSQAVAEEVVQETWLAVIEGISAFEGRSRLRTWIIRILMNRARTRGLKEARSLPLAVTDEGDPLAGRFSENGAWLVPPKPFGGDPEQLASDRECRALIETAIAELPEAQRAVMEMRDVSGLDGAEVCELLGLSESNQRVLLHRARTRVRAVLEQHLGARAS